MDLNCKYILNAYIERFDSLFALESYKWDAVRLFNEIYNNESKSFADRLSSALALADNLLASNNYYPARMLVFFAMERETETLAALNSLLNESESLAVRVATFIDETEAIFQKMKKGGYRDWKDRTNVQSFQDTHATSVYLALHDPANNYIYKWTVFKNAAKILGYKIETKNKIEKLTDFYSFCDNVKIEIMKEKEFVAKYDQKLKEKDYIDPNYNLLTQDFIYAIATYLNADDFQKKDKKKKLAQHTMPLEAKEFFPFEPKIETCFKGKKNIDYAKQDALFRDIGLFGEIWAVNYEKERLAEKGITFEVRHASILDGDGLGYDILSVEDDGITPRYIEVKTTTGGAYQPFYFSVNELNRSIHDASHYYLYRVCNFKSAVNQADVIIVHGSLEEINASPVLYKAEI